MDLFNELLETVLNQVESDPVEVSHLVCIPALGYLRNIADDMTIDRCLKKLQAERENLRK